MKEKQKQNLKKSKGTSQSELYNLLLSQAKASDRLMKVIQTSLVDHEYKLDKNPSNKEVIKECNSQINTLKELLRDFDTLISFSRNA